MTTTNRKPPTDEEREATLNFFCATDPEGDALTVLQAMDWECPKCQYKNHPDRDDCKICLTTKPILVEELVATIPTEHATTTATNTNFTHVLLEGVSAKTCATCGQWKRREEFAGHGRSADGLQASCKECAAKNRAAAAKVEDHRPMVSTDATSILRQMSDLTLRICDLEEENAMLRGAAGGGRGQGDHVPRRLAGGQEVTRGESHAE